MGAPLSFGQGTICWCCRTLTYAPTSRSVSTLSAINRGLRATRDAKIPAREDVQPQWRRQTQGPSEWRMTHRRDRQRKLVMLKEGSAVAVSRRGRVDATMARRTLAASQPTNRTQADIRRSVLPGPSQKKSAEAVHVKRVSKNRVKLLRVEMKQLRLREQNGVPTDEAVKQLKYLVARVNESLSTADVSQAGIEEFFIKSLGAHIVVREGDVNDRTFSRLVIRPDKTLYLSQAEVASTPHPPPSPVKKKEIHDASDRYIRPPSNGQQRMARGTRMEERKSDDEENNVPMSVPYTTAASQFLYGSNVVLAALRAKRRQLYRMHIHPKAFGRDRDSGASYEGTASERPMQDLIALAKSNNVPVSKDTSLHVLDRMSDGRPHNGIVLETSKLPAAPVLGLGRPDRRSAHVPLSLAHQSAEAMKVNGVASVLPALANSWRHPFIVFLDGITDPGNVGNIIRTCHFYGVDAVAIAQNTCANLTSAVLAKASSGACEAIPILSLPQPSSFAYESAKAGWRLYAAVAPLTPTSKKSVKDVQKQMTTIDIIRTGPLARQPCILMLGAEGEGLREILRNRAEFHVTITAGERAPEAPDLGVDSMNVGVAAGILMEAFMRRPASAPQKRDTAGELGW